MGRARTRNYVKDQKRKAYTLFWLRFSRYQSDAHKYAYYFLLGAMITGILSIILSLVR